MSGSKRRPTERRDAPGDALYSQLQRLLQQGRWQEAHTVLEVLSRRHADSAELAGYRQLLEMRLSAEETWASARRRGARQLCRAWAGALRRPAIRGLLVANVVVYLLLLLLLFLGGRPFGA